MKSLKIEIPKGYEVDNFDQSTGEIKFKKRKPKNIREQLQDFNDVLEYHGLTEEQFNDNNKGLTPDEVGYRKEKLIVAAYNEGKKPDWNDGTPKRYPLFDLSSSGFRSYVYDGWHSYSDVGSRLCFVGPDALENLRDAVDKFLDEYKESRTL